MDEKKLRETKSRVAEAALEGAKSIYKSFAPHWHSRADALKTLISLSSGSIVLSVTFASSVKSSNVGATWRYLVLFSFVMFALSVITGLAALWISVGLHSFESDVLNNRTEIGDTVDKVDPASDDLTAPFAPVFDALLKPIAIRDMWAGRLSNISIACFGLAVVSLTIIGVMQFLP